MKQLRNLGKELFEGIGGLDLAVVGIKNVLCDPVKRGAMEGQ